MRKPFSSTVLFRCPRGFNKLPGQLLAFELHSSLTRMASHEVLESGPIEPKLEFARTSVGRNGMLRLWIGMTRRMRDALIIFKQMDSSSVPRFNSRLRIESSSKDDQRHCDNREHFFRLASHRYGRDMFGPREDAKVGPHDGYTIEGRCQNDETANPRGIGDDAFR